MSACAAVASIASVSAALSAKPRCAPSPCQALRASSPARRRPAFCAADTVSDVVAVAPLWP
ncbi:MAG: hypothetical protein ACLUNO_08455 [Oscillospiraceae bacterium]